MKTRILFLVSGIAAVALVAHEPPPAPEISRAPSAPWVATFSIVARDPDTGEIGVAVQSRVLGVGAIVPFAKAGVGAIATQASANTTYGPDGLKLLGDGKSAAEALATLTEADPKREIRQAGIVAVKGEPATFTGSGCMDASAFENTQGTLAERMLAALDAGQGAGGDKRGMQSAALLIVHDGWGYGGQNDRYIDLRVDDHAEPIKELRRLMGLHAKLFGRPAVEGK